MLQENSNQPVCDLRFLYYILNLRGDILGVEISFGVHRDDTLMDIHDDRN